MNDQLDLFASSCYDEQPSQSKQEESKLTERQQKLYELIYNNSCLYVKKTTQAEIVDKLGYLGYEWNEDEKAHDHCSAVWNDIMIINMSLEKDQLIISHNFEYWIGNKEETTSFLKKLWRDLAPRLIRYWTYCKKVRYDGQGHGLDQGTLQFFDMFNKYNVSMESEDLE